MQRSSLRLDTVFAVAHARIIHESVEAEDALLIDLDRGVYYNLRGVAATIWKSAVSGLSLEAIAGAVEKAHSGCEEGVAEVVAAFARQLIDEGLLTPGVATNGATAAPAVAARRGTPYGAPILERYTDLEELLRADPICEVSDPQA